MEGVIEIFQNLHINIRKFTMISPANRKHE